MAEVVLFILAATGALAGGVGIILAHPPVRAALALLLVLGSLAVLYLLLAAQFIAVLQVIIYAGAIVVLFLFVVMLLHIRSGEGRATKLPRQRPVGLVLAAAFLAAAAAVLRTAATPPPPAVGGEFGTAQAVAETLFTRYVLPFELASMILIVGIVAAVVLARGAPP
ncbi:MAG: NADH-quinone oxidoreductase subunit J [Armatimonadota bacterium]|nr:NADH-quinone oxidoreductase subunit J [Armatimonadota bacterium]MDR7499709.1 NADH-quinone oxidoreductase subunit J [Armatimonadota bacterium]MDR7558576.1 NADH-quinone oxidoreductase subunit J [Armatimonadota bacterium]MDR7573292.1 NADH-quinone oxidoreductase subunit J [Armatimonadota bacterium]